MPDNAYVRTGRYRSGCNEKDLPGKNEPGFAPAAGENRPANFNCESGLIDECKVLVVDDDHLVRHMLANFFARFGYPVTKAVGGPEAVVYISRSHYHLVLTHLEMPELDGYQVAHQIKRQSPCTKVVIMTECGPTEVSRRTTGEIDGWLFIPFRIMDLGKVLSALNLPNAFQAFS